MNERRSFDETEVKDAIFRGQKIRAIKLYRKGTGCGLKEAKEAIEKLEADLRAKEPWQFTVADSGRGCLGSFLALAGIGLLMLLWFAK